MPRSRVPRASSLFTSQDQLAQSQRDVALDLLALYKAVGGGWDVARQTAAADRDGPRRGAASDGRAAATNGGELRRAAASDAAP